MARPAAAVLPVSYDVVVIGKSLAALVTAVEASSRGAAVIVFSEADCPENAPLEEGMTVVAEGGPSRQPRSEDGLSLRQTLSYSGRGAGQEWFFSLLAANSYRDLIWFAMETGLDLIPEPPLHYLLTGSSPENIRQGLMATACAAGAQFKDGVSIGEVRQNEAPSFFRIDVQFGNSVHREIVARSIIFADGGYLNQPQLMENEAPSIEPAPWRRVGTGKGLRLAQELNLDLVQMDSFSYGLGIQQYGQWVEAVLPGEAVLVIGTEIIPLAGKPIPEVIVILQENRYEDGYLLIAENRLRDEERWRCNWPVYTGIDNFINYYDLDCPDLLRWAAGRGSYFRGTPVKEMAEYCLGGIAVNEDGLVLRRGKPVPGLYAVGEITGGLHGLSLYPGAAMTEALVLGRKIGVEAAAWATK